MQITQRRSHGFTIVELLVVIVVIAILAAITIVSYNGITGQAEESRLKSELRSDNTIIVTDYIKNGVYPSSLSTAQDGTGITSTSSELDYIATQNTFCLQATSLRSADLVAHITESGVIEEGGCPGLVATADSCFFLSGDMITVYFDYEDDNAANPACPRNVVIPSVINGVTVTSISSAFTSRSITSVVIPNTVTTIHGSAFTNNSLETLSIPSSVTLIAANAFTNNNLTSLTIPDTLQTIGDSAFAGNEISSLSIGSGLNTIGVNAFAGNALTNVYVPFNVTGIGGGAFSGQTAGALHCNLPDGNGFNHTTLGCTTGDYYQ